MFAWDYCNKSFCMLLVLFTLTSQQSINDNLEFRHHSPPSQYDEPEPRNEQSRKAVSPQSSAVVVNPVVQYEEDHQQILEHPNLVREVESQLQDNDKLEGNEYQDQQQKKQNAEIEDVIQQIFSPNNIQEYKNRDLIGGDPVNLKHSFPQSNMYKRVVIKGGRPGGKILKRKLLLKRLKSPMFRSGQPKSEQSSEELLHNILESIDQDNSEHGNPIKNAFLTKTTTYNISKLHEDGRNRSFLIEKLVNYSTNINMLHSDTIPTNYSDTHSSVLQTVLNLCQHDKNTDNIINDDENGKQSYSSSDNENNLLNDIVGSQVKLDGSEEDSEMLRKSPENHQAPTEFLGGQYLQLPNKSSFPTSKQADTNNSNELGSSDFVGGQFIGMANKTDRSLEKHSDSLESKDLKNNPLDFVGGQFVEQPFNLEKKHSGTSNLDFVNISGTNVGHQIATEDNATPTTVTNETPTYTTDIPSLSLTKELLDVKESKDQSTSNVLKNKGKLEKHAISEKAVDNKAVTIPTNPYGTNKIKTTEGEKNMLFPKNNIQADKQNSSHSSTIDDNSNPQLYDLYPLNSVPGKSASEIQSDNGYESTTITDEIQDKVEMLPGDEKRSSKPDEFQMKKKIQDSTPKPVFDDNYKIPSKAVGPETKIFINSIENNRRSGIGGFNNGKNIKYPLETTPVTDYESLFEQSSSTSERPKDTKKSSSLTENEEVLLQSEEVSDLPEGVAHQSSHGSPQNSSNSENNNNFFVGLPLSNEEDVRESSEKSVEEQSSSTPKESELFSGENEEYFVGLKPNRYGSILKTDPATGTLVTERIGDYNPSKFTTQVNSFEELESVTTMEPISKTREFDQVIGEASDIQQSKLGSGSIDIESQDQLSSEKQLSQEQNLTSLIDEVELYAGKATVSEPVSEDQTTQNYDSGSGEIYKHPYEIVSSDSSSEENTTQLCLPLTKKNYPKLLDLLSGKLFLEKDGKRVNLQIKDNPMKNCNSGTKICKLYFDLKESSKPSMSEEMFEIPEDKKNTKGLNSKSKNEKRHVSEEYADLKIPEPKTEFKNSGKNTERTETMDELSHENEHVILLTLNKSATNQNVSDLSQTEISGFSKAPSRMKLLPVQSMFVRLPVPYKTHLGDQNIHTVTNDNERKIASQMNGEKITLHNLDSPYHKFGYPSGNQLARKIHQKRDSYGHLGGACGCNNPLLLSPSPVPDYRHFVGKRLAILTNIVHTVKDWATQDSLRP